MPLSITVPVDLPVIVFCFCIDLKSIVYLFLKIEIMISIPIYKRKTPPSIPIIFVIRGLSRYFNIPRKKLITTTNSNKEWPTTMKN